LSVHLRLRRMRDSFCPPYMVLRQTLHSSIEYFLKVFCPNSRLKTRTEDYYFTFGYFLRSLYCNSFSRECCNVHFRPDARYQYSNYASWIKIGKTVSFVSWIRKIFLPILNLLMFCAMGNQPLYFLRPNVISVVHVSGSQHWIDIVMRASTSFLYQHAHFVVFDNGRAILRVDY
jgi:hypothetical protein